MAAWTTKDRIQCVYKLGKYRLSSSSGSATITSAHNTFIATTGTQTDIVNYLNTLLGLDKATLSGPDEQVAESLIEALYTAANDGNSLIRNSDDSADIEVAEAVGGSPATGLGNGLSKLNSDFSVRSNMVMVSNSLFVQKTPLLALLCGSGGNGVAGRTIDILNHMLDTVTYPPGYGGGNIKLQCAERMGILNYGGTSGTQTIDSAYTTKTSCEAEMSSFISTLGGAAGTFLRDGLYSEAQITAEVCAQFDLL